MMKKIILFSVLFIFIEKVFAQKQTFDLISFTPPNTWKKELKETAISYTFTNNENKSWCQIRIYKSTISKGSIEQDFESEWQELIVDQYQKIKVEPGNNEIREVGTRLNDKVGQGWKIKKGAGKFTFNSNEGMFIINTMSGYKRCISIVVITNSNSYLPVIENFLASVEIKKPSSDNTVSQPVISPVSSNKFGFSTTNFDDGWTSTVQEDWVEVSKGTTKVLLHYPKEGTIFPADPEPVTKAAWNILVAPRYSNLNNFGTSTITSYSRPYLGFGYATDNTTQKKVYILIFRRGQTGWLEVVTKDKNSFIQQYKFDPESLRWDSEIEVLSPLIEMFNYNKFAVAASDFSGRWTSDFTGLQQLYNIYTGDYAGMNMSQSNEEFDFKGGNTYNWKLLVVNGMVGTMKYNQVKSSGSFNILNNWQVKFSMIENKPRTYNAYWSCIKGTRILNLLDADFPGAGIYTRYGKAK